MTAVPTKPDAAPAQEPKKKRKYVRLTTAQKAEACALYRAGDHTVADLAAKYGCSRDTLDKLFAETKTVKGSDQEAQRQKAEAVISAALTLDPAVHAKRVFDTKNETYRGTEMLRKLTIATVVKAKQDNKPLGSIVNDLKALREAAMVLKISREEAYAVLGISADPVETEDDIPELRIASLTPEDIRALQAAPTAPHLDDDELGDLTPSEEDSQIDIPPEELD